MGIKVVHPDQGMNIPPRVSVSPKGTFNFNSSALDILGIQNPTRIEFLHDSDRNDWFIRVSNKGYLLIDTKVKSNNRMGYACMVGISRKITDSFYHIGENALKFNIKKPRIVEGDQVFQMTIMKNTLKMDIPNPNSR